MEKKVWEELEQDCVALSRNGRAFSFRTTCNCAREKRELHMHMF